MSIPDGEYEIDILALLQQNASREIGPESIAIRYGFIPDSMDQSKPLKLYQNNEICILEAQLIDRNTRALSKPPSVIFEGVPQRPRSSQGQPVDSYYLLLQPATDSSKTPSVKLRQLGSTIRVSKTRNAEKWRKSIGEWKSLAESDSPIPTISTGIPETTTTALGSTTTGASVGSNVGKQTQDARATNIRMGQNSSISEAININVNGALLEAQSKTSSKPQSPKPTDRESKASDTRNPKTTSPLKGSISSKAPPKGRKPATSNASRGRNITSKRPPTSTPEVKEDIISVSDFEDLDSADELDLNSTAIHPKVASKRPQAKPETMPETLAKPHPKTLSKMRPKTLAKSQQKTQPKQQQQEQQHPDFGDVSFNDEFQDLEDQLEEVLENSDDAKPLLALLARPAVDSDSDSDEDADLDAFSGGPIVIDMELSEPSKRGSRMAQASATSKPMSLRDLYGEGRNEDYSCSEEE